MLKQQLQFFCLYRMSYGFLEFLLASESLNWDLVRKEQNQIICILIHCKCGFETNVLYTDPHGFAFI
jgi:hypothetical protein